MEGIVDANQFDLNDIDKMSTTGARAVVDMAHVQLTEEMRSQFQRAKEKLTPTDADSLQTLQDKILAIAAQREGRSKTKSLVGQQELDAVDRLIGNYQEGADALNTLRQLNELTNVHNSGYQGGISKYTDQLAPFGSKVGYDKSQVATEALLRPLASGGLALQTGGASIAGQLAAVGTGRAVDRMTGRRSRVRRFIEQNAGQTGQTQQDLPSLAGLREAQRIQEEAEAAAAAERTRLANQELSQAGAPATPDSPQFIMQQATGLPVEDIMASLPAVVERFPSLSQAAAEFETSVTQGINRVSDLSPLVRGVKAVTGRDADADRLQLSPLEQAQAASGLYQMTDNYKRGIADNQRVLNELQDAVNEDKTLPPADKAIILNGLSEMGKNLGSNPVEAVQAKMKDLVGRAQDKEAAQKYLMPYVERVMGQQNAKKQISDFADQVEDDIKDFSRTTMPDFPEGNPMRVSPSRPEGAKRIADPMSDDRQIGLAQIQDDPQLFEKIETTVADYVGVPNPDGNTEGAIQRLINHSIDNLRHLYNSVTPEFRERARQWYVGANRLSQAVADQNGLSIEAVSGVMASLSPQKDWYMNYDLGVRTINVVMNHQDSVFDADMRQAFVDMIENKQAKRTATRKKELYDALDQVDGKTLRDIDPDFKAIFIRFHDAIHNPEKGHRVVTPEGELGDFVRTKKGAKYGTAWNGFRDIQKAASILADPSRQNINDQLGEKHKVRSFYNNILDPFAPQGDVTIDTHAVAAALLRPLSGNSIEVLHNFKDAGTSKNAGVFGSYGVYAEAYRQLANELGIQPRELQSITWEAVRNLFTAGFKAQKKNVDAVDGIFKKYTDGTISIDEARSQIYETAGGINRAEWEGSPRPNDADDAQVGNQTQSGILSQSGISGRGSDGRVASQSAGLLSQPSEVVNRQETLFLEEEIQSTRDDIGAPDLPIRAPTPTEVADQLPRVKAMFEIGKKGGDFEKGLNFEDAKDIGRALGYVIVDAKNKTEMGKIIGEKIKPNSFVAGVNIEEAVSGAPKLIAVMQQGYKNPKDPDKQNMSSIDYLYTMLHEAVGHVLEKRRQGVVYSPVKDMSGNVVSPTSGFPNFQNMTYTKEGQTVTQGNAEFRENPVYPEGQLFEYRKPVIYSPVKGGTEGGFADSVRAQFSEAIKAGETKNFDADAAVDDLVRHQKSVTTSGRNPEIGGMTVRNEYEYYERALARGVPKHKLDHFIRHAQRVNMHMIAELLADGVAGYAINPDAFKKNFPDAAKMIRYYFNNPNNPTSKTVQFYAHPLATVLAVMLAMIGAAASGGGEEEQPQGALSPQGGALTI
jgi:hypothetical protein